MQRMTEPGSMQGIADTVSIPSRAGEHIGQSVLKPVARPIQPLLALQRGPYGESGIADAIQTMV